MKIQPRRRRMPMMTLICRHCLQRIHHVLNHSSLFFAGASYETRAVRLVRVMSYLSREYDIRR